MDSERSALSTLDSSESTEKVKEESSAEPALLFFDLEGKKRAQTDSVQIHFHPKNEELKRPKTIEKKYIRSPKHDPKLRVEYSLE
jgi:hypothetical protein